jgi:hypothetical protein
MHYRSFGIGGTSYALMLALLLYAALMASLNERERAPAARQGGPPNDRRRHVAPYCHHCSGSADQADATSLSSDPANRLHPENPDRVMPRLDLLTTCFSTDAIFAAMAGFPINTQGHGVIHHRRASLGLRDT